MVVAGEGGAISPLDLRSFHHASHLAEPHATAIAHLDHDPLDIVDGFDPAQRADQVLIGALFVQIAAGRVLVALLERRFDLVERNAVSEQCARIDEHLELLAAASHHEHLRYTGDGQELLADHPVGQRAQLQGRRFAPLAVHPHDQDLPHDAGDGSQLRIDADGQLVGHHGQPFVNDLAIVVDVGSPIEFHIDHRDANA